MTQESRIFLSHDWFAAAARFFLALDPLLLAPAQRTISKPFARRRCRFPMLKALHHHSIIIVPQLNWTNLPNSTRHIITRPRILCWSKDPSLCIAYLILDSSVKFETMFLEHLRQVRRWPPLSTRLRDTLDYILRKQVQCDGQNLSLRLAHGLSRVWADWHIMFDRTTTLLTHSRHPFFFQHG